MSVTTTRPAPETDLAILRAMASETRYGALRYLADADGEVCACELTEPLGVSQSTVSHALSRLHDAGLVTRRKDGRWRYYQPTDRAAELLAAFDAVRPTGVEQ